MKQIARIVSINLIFWCLFLFTGGLDVSALTLPNYATRSAQVTISATLGEPILKLWGYGPSSSRVELGGFGVSDFTYAAFDGYFEFSKAYLPTPTGLLYPELCLTGIDLENRATPPTCIPALPVSLYSYDIGPVILPPTLSLEAGSSTMDNQTAATGSTLPNSEVKIVLAEGEDGGFLTNFSLVSTAKAYYIPNYTIRSDSRGNFSFNMPNITPNKWRVFAITTYSQGATSPKSNTLTYKIISPTLAVLESFWMKILSLLTLPVFIILEIAVLIFIIALTLVGKRRKKKLYPNVIYPIK